MRIEEHGSSGGDDSSPSYSEPWSTAIRGVTTSGLVVRVGRGVIPSVATYDRAFHSLILDRPITTAGILKLLGEIVELFLELVGHGVFAVAHSESVAGAPTRAKAKVKLEQPIVRWLLPPSVSVTGFASGGPALPTSTAMGGGVSAACHY